MTIRIMSRSNAIRYAMEAHSEAAAVISISDCDKDSPVLELNPDNGIAARCMLKFDDVERGEVNAITAADVLKIVEFAADAAKEQDMLIVHCEAGVSRSAGVAAAIMKAVNGSDMEVFRNRRYVPNMTCYRAVLDAFYDEGRIHSP